MTSGVPSPLSVTCSSHGRLRWLWDPQGAREWLGTGRALALLLAAPAGPLQRAGCRREGPRGGFGTLGQDPGVVLGPWGNLGTPQAGARVPIDPQRATALTLVLRVVPSGPEGRMAPVPVSPLTSGTRTPGREPHRAGQALAGSSNVTVLKPAKQIR